MSVAWIGREKQEAYPKCASNAGYSFIHATASIPCVDFIRLKVLLIIDAKDSKNTDRV